MPDTAVDRDGSPIDKSIQKEGGTKAMALQDSYLDLMKQAEALEAEGKDAEALNIYRRVVARLSQVNTATLEKHGDLVRLIMEAAFRSSHDLRRAEQFEDALAIFESVQKALPAMTPTWVYYQAQVRADAGDIDQAMLLLHEASTMETAAPSLKLSLASEALWNDRAQDALDILASVPETMTPAQAQRPGRKDEDDQDNWIPGLWYLRFRALSKLDRIEEAERAWEQAKKASGGIVPSDEIVELFIARGELKKALEYADRESEPFGRGMLRGLVAALSGKMEWARDEWWRVTRETYNPEDDSLFDWLECALRLDDPEKIEAALHDGFEKQPQSIRLALYRGILLAKRGDLETARTILDMVAEIHGMNRLNRARLIMPADRWLVEQSLPEGEARDLVLTALFSKPSIDPKAGDSPSAVGPLEPPTDVAGA
jgi:tetratricopeptide (TPR) repeat protein